jgi:LIM domain
LTINREGKNSKSYTRIYFDKQYQSNTYIYLFQVIYSNGEGDYNRSMNTNPKINTGHSSYQYNSYGGSGPEQFSCYHCERNLSGSRYILKDEHPYCIKCYEDRFANMCEECRRKIGTDSKDLSYKDRHWHEKCFFCSMCKTPLVDKPFGCKNEQLFCGECYNQQFASRCDKCHQIFKPGIRINLLLI